MPAKRDVCESHTGAETIATGTGGQSSIVSEGARKKGPERWGSDYGIVTRTILDHDVETLLDEEVIVQDNKPEG